MKTKPSHPSSNDSTNHQFANETHTNTTGATTYYKKPSIFPLVAWSTILIGCIATLVHLTNRPTAQPPTIDRVPLPIAKEEPAKENQVDLQKMRAEFFDASVTPVIEKTYRQNKLAADRVTTKIRQLFAGYSEGTQPFVNDIMSFGARWNTLINLGSDWWYEGKSSSEMVSAKFQKYYFKEDELKNSLTEILNDFRDEIRANQRMMLSEIDANAKNSSIPNLIIPAYDEFSKEITFKLRNMSARAATQSTLDGIVTLLASEAGAVAVQQLASQILTRLGTTATSAAAAGGGSAMASGAAAGGGGGAFGGPVGIAVGACAGIAVGIVIDHFMNKSSKVKLTNQMDRALIDFERTILWGQGGSGGLNSALNLACDKYNESVKSSLFETVINKTEGN